MVQVDKRSHLVLFKQNQRNHDPYTSELQKAYKTDYLVDRHNMMGTVSKLYVSNNTWIYVYMTKTWQNFNSNSNSNSREFQLQFQLQLQEFQLQLQLRQVSWISTPTPTPGVSTPTPTPASLLNINSKSNSKSFNSNSNSNSGVGVGVEPNSNSDSGVDPNPDRIAVWSISSLGPFCWRVLSDCAVTWVPRLSPTGQRGKLYEKKNFLHLIFTFYLNTNASVIKFSPVVVFQ